MALAVILKYVNSRPICRCLQIILQIQGSVHLVGLHLELVISMPPVTRLHLTCVPVTQPAATGVNAIKDIPAME